MDEKGTAFLQEVGIWTLCYEIQGPRPGQVIFFFRQDSLLLQPLSIRRLKCVLALCYRNQDKLWPDRALDLSVYLTFLPSLWAISKTASNIG